VSYKGCSTSTFEGRCGTSSVPSHSEPGPSSGEEPERAGGKWVESIQRESAGKTEPGQKREGRKEGA
jgi:hypothetical protein